MQKIVNVKEAAQIAKKINKEGKKIVLAGGCFDILHVGHLNYLKGAKERGDVLFVLLESDENIKKIKKRNRPINSQTDRAKILSSLEIVDYVITLPKILNDIGYDKLVIALKPAIIATTKGDRNRFHKERQAKFIKAAVVDVTTPIVRKSTSRLVKLLRKLI